MLREYRQETKGAVTSLWLDVINKEEITFLLQSDIHHDSIACNREILKSHLDKALARNAFIAIFGDLFDAMQGRFDPRRSMDELRPEYRRDDYLDFVVKDLAEFYEPYAKNIILIARGNHETSVLKNLSTDLIDRLVFMLNLTTGSRIISGGFGGWIRMLFDVSGGKKAGPRKSLKMKYFHGAGSDAPVTKGVIQTNRQAVYLPDADIVVNGHNHNMYIVPIARERLNQAGTLGSDIQYHVRIPGYKQDYFDGSKGWTVERGGPPKPIGAVWLTTIINANGPIRLRLEPDICGPEMIPGIDRKTKLPKTYPQDSEYP